MTPLAYMHVLFVCAQSLSGVRLCDHRTVDCQAPLSMGFSRQKYWSRLTCWVPAMPPAPCSVMLGFTVFALSAFRQLISSALPTEHVTSGPVSLR